MRAIATLMVVSLVAACGGDADEAPPEESAAATMQAEGPSMPDLTGTWNATAMVDGTPDPVLSQLEFAADGSAMMTLPDRDPMAVDVSMSGDSVIISSPEYQSVIRDGVSVSIRLASLVDGDMMTGRLVATYRSAEGEEIVGGSLEAHRGGM